MLEQGIFVLFQLILLMVCFEQFENSAFNGKNLHLNILDKPVNDTSNRTLSTNNLSDVFGVKFRRYLSQRRKRDAEGHYQDFIQRRAKKDKYGEFAKLSINKTKTGEMNINCTYDNEEIRDEKFQGAFFEVKRHKDTGYHILLGLLHNFNVVWSNKVSWPQSINIGGSPHQSATVFHRNHSKILSLYVSPDNCETQGKYRCVVFVERILKYKFVRSGSVEWMTTECSNKILQELKKSDPVYLYRKRLITENDGKRAYTGPKIAHIDITTTEQGPAKITCKWNNREHRREQFVAAFIDIRTSDKGGYKNIILMKHNKQLVWSNQLKWPHHFEIDGSSKNSAVGHLAHKSGTYLKLYASKKECDVDQGWYKCTIFVKKTGNKLIYKTAVKTFMTIDCMTRNGRFRSKAGWGAGASDAKNLDQFLFEMNSVSGKVLGKSSTQQLVNITRGTYKYHYRGRTRTFAAHECKPTFPIIQKATHTLGFVFEIKKFNESHYQPIAGINDRNQVIWSDTLYWEEKYICGKNSKKCPMAFGSVLDDPYLVLYTKDCKTNRGYYKCNIFVQLAASPSSEALTLEVPFNYSDCGKHTGVIRPHPNKSINVVQLNQIPVKKKENYTDVAIGSVVGVLVLVILVFLIWNTKKKMRQNREKEEQIMLLHQQNVQGITPYQSKGAENSTFDKNQITNQVRKEPDWLLTKKSSSKEIKNKKSSIWKIVSSQDTQDKNLQDRNSSTSMTKSNDS